MNYGELVHSETENGITYNVYVTPDEMDVRGNALASGDDAEDKAAEDEILARLEDGDTWAWACVTVEAEYEGLSATDHLGGCCYRDTAEFIAPDGYYPSMKAEALRMLVDKARAGSEIYRKLVELVNVTA